MQPKIIDFELDTTDSIGFYPIEGKQINNEYFIKKYGVSFHINSLRSPVAPVISEVGNPATAFKRNRSRFKNEDGKYIARGDYPEDSLKFGQFFITDDGKLNTDRYDLYVNYEKKNCSKASGYIIDVDGPERWLINAYSTTDSIYPVKSISICSGNEIFWTKSDCDITDIGDGKGTYWALDISPEIIDHIAILYDDRLSGNRPAGLAFDNFSFCSLEKEEPIINKKMDWDTIAVGQSIILKNVEFEFNKSELMEVSILELEKLYTFLQTHPEINMEISGHTDNIGNKDFNKKLSEDRAKSVVLYLISKGIDEKRLIPIGYGDSKPIEPNDNEENRQKNRRVEFKIIK